MKAWDECKFILETLFEGNRHGDANDSVAAIKPPCKQKTKEPKMKQAGVKPSVTPCVNKVTGASKKMDVEDASLLREHNLNVICSPSRSIHSKVSRVTEKQNFAVRELSPQCQPPVSSVQLKAVASTHQKVTRATAKLNLAVTKLSPERQSATAIKHPVLSIKPKEAVASYQRKITRATARLNLALLDPSAEIQPKNVVQTDPPTTKQTKSNSLPIVQRKVTRAMAKADSGRAPLAENCNLGASKKTQKRKAECDAISIPKKKKKP